MRKLIAMLLASSLLVFSCSACSSKNTSSEAADSQFASETTTVESEFNSDIQSFAEEVQNGNYLNAIDEYNEYIYGNSILENEASLFLQDLLFNTLDAYNQGTSSETDFTNVYLTVEKVDDTLHIITFALTDAQERFMVLTDSKANYQSGIEYMNNSDYLAAADCFSKVSSLDVNYEDAQSSYENALDGYVQQVISTAEEKIANGEYETAIGIVDTAEYSAGWHSEYDDLRAKAYTMAAEESVNNAIDADDYPTAKAAYENNVDNTYVTFSVDTITRLETAKTDYRNSIKDSARQTADKKNYSEALGTIDSGLLVLENDADLLQFQTEMQAEYDDYLLRTTPVSLAALTPYQQKHMDSSKSEDEDIFGKTYSTRLESNERDAYATYRIDGIYKTFTGSFYIRTDYNDTPRTVSIYGDGKKLFDATINGGEDPTQFSIDVTGVRDLTINLEGYWSWATILGDPILTP